MTVYLVSEKFANDLEEWSRDRFKKFLRHFCSDIEDHDRIDSELTDQTGQDFDDFLIERCGMKSNERLEDFMMRKNKDKFFELMSDLYSDYMGSLIDRAKSLREDCR